MTAGDFQQQADDTHHHQHFKNGAGSHGWFFGCLWRPEIEDPAARLLMTVEKVRTAICHPVGKIARSLTDRISEPDQTSQSAAGEEYKAHQTHGVQPLSMDFKALALGRNTAPYLAFDAWPCGVPRRLRTRQAAGKRASGGEDISCGVTSSVASEGLPAIRIVADGVESAGVNQINFERG